MPSRWRRRPRPSGRCLRLTGDDPRLTARACPRVGVGGAPRRGAAPRQRRCFCQVGRRRPLLRAGGAALGGGRRAVCLGGGQGAANHLPARGPVGRGATGHLQGALALLLAPSLSSSRRIFSASLSQVLGLLLAQRGANPFVRDARGNLAVHLACAAEDVDAVSQLVAQPQHGLHVFNGAYLNLKKQKPNDLCEHPDKDKGKPAGPVYKLVEELKAEAARKAQAAEDRLKKAGGAPSCIDSFLNADATVASLLGRDSAAASASKPKKLPPLKGGAAAPLKGNTSSAARPGAVVSAAGSATAPAAAAATAAAGGGRAREMGIDLLLILLRTLPVGGRARAEVRRAARLRVPAGAGGRDAARAAPAGLPRRDAPPQGHPHAARPRDRRGRERLEAARRRAPLRRAPARQQDHGQRRPLRVGARLRRSPLLRGGRRRGGGCWPCCLSPSPAPFLPLLPAASSLADSLPRCLSSAAPSLLAAASLSSRCACGRSRRPRRTSRR